jgi:hypothetical protein
VHRRRPFPLSGVGRLHRVMAPSAAPVRSKPSTVPPLLMGKRYNIIATQYFVISLESTLSHQLLWRFEYSGVGCQ